MKNYVGFSRDHSASMASSRLTESARKDYNDNIAVIKESANENGIDSIVSVVRCGVGPYALIEREVVNSSVNALTPITQYKADGHATPLFDSVGELIEMFESVPDVNDITVSFQIMAITDGCDNYSKKYPASVLSAKIKQLQATDRWTFVFRVPRGYKRDLVHLGIPEGNILEWETTQRGVQQATEATSNAFKQYFTGLKSGVKSTNKFYTDLSQVDPTQIKKSLTDITNQVQIWSVQTLAEGARIDHFCESKSGKPFRKGAAFYQLMKPEKAVQDYKLIAIREKKTGLIYSGAAARDLLSLPHYGTVAVNPGDHGNYDVYIQSTSFNRKLPVGTTVLYWENIL